MDDRGFILDHDATHNDVYTKLAPLELRTLLIAPGVKGSPVFCEMQVISSPKSTQYEALSYVWGDTTKSKAISCNGFKFLVTESLYNALVHVRYVGSWRRVWVDQLSINQAENDEVMAQVGQMGTIYSSASRVIVWLGEFDQKMALAWELLQETSLSTSLVRSDFLQPPSDPPTPRILRSSSRRASSGSSISRYSKHGSSSRESLASSTSSLGSISPIRPNNKRHNTPPAFKYALSIFQHIWFGRKWTFQEIVLAKAAIICCGDLEMAWSDLTSWYFHYASKFRSSSLLYDSHGSFENIMNVRNEMDKGNLRLSYLLMLTRPRLSTKPEDAIYALLGLIPDFTTYLEATAESLRVHENSSDRDTLILALYLSAFKYCLEKENDLAILSAAGKYKGNQNSEAWPSWLPDWRQQLPLRPLVLTEPPILGPEAAFDEETFGPSSSPSPEIVTVPVYKLNDMPSQTSLSLVRTFSITVQGVRLGCIAKRSGSWPSTFLVPDTLAHNRLQFSKRNHQDNHFLQPITSLVSSNLTPLKIHRRARSQSYSDGLIERSLKAKVDCESVRTSTAAEAGDWVCALQGGRVLYVLRPVYDFAMAHKEDKMRPQDRLRTGHMGKLGPPYLSSARPQALRPFKCVFVGECAVCGLHPTELIDASTSIEEKLLEFELV